MVSDGNGVPSFWEGKAQEGCVDFFGQDFNAIHLDFEVGVVGDGGDEIARGFCG